MRNKLYGVFLVCIVLFVVLIVRVTLINATNGAAYKMKVLSQAQSRYESRVMPAKRGDILDRNGKVLATSAKVFRVILDCKAVNSNEMFIDPTVDALVEIFGLDEGELRTRLTSEATRESQYQIIAKNISMDEKKAFEDYAYPAEELELSEDEREKREKIRGVWFEENYLRSYPFGEMACDTIGFTYGKDNADWGLEGYYNTLLAGVDGRQYGYFNSSADVEQTIIAPANGSNIRTTLDMGAQEIVEKYVNAYNAAVGGEHVGVIVEDPKTGEILAMDGGDRYDLNAPGDIKGIEDLSDEEASIRLAEVWNNYCVSDAFEPGSVVKPIVLASALEKGKISPNDNFVCDGFQSFGANGETVIRCAVYPDAHGQEDLDEVIAYSCNDAMMQIGTRMGVEQFVKMQNVFNFGARTGIDLPNEGNGMIHTAQTMGETELATCSFGQGFTCTMIQEINALCSLINGGNYYQPHLIRSVTDENGKTTRIVTPTLLKQTVSETISKMVREYMEATVLYGTAYRTRLTGYSMGGKTGTAEKLPRGNGKYLVSFISFVPVDDPQVVVYCVVDEPNVEDQGNCVHPQYIVQAIMTELLPYLDIKPDEPENGIIEDTVIWGGFNGILDETAYADGEVVTDEDGNLVDWDGRRIDNKGYLLYEDGTYRTDDNGNFIRSSNIAGMAVASNLREAISDTNIPEPLRDYSDPVYGNNMESEGLTNEEAGLD
ncbi:MAG: cell division protein FtsI [Blautia sp.]|nr:cell division protein FtsI [Blautia sp.]